MKTLHHTSIAASVFQVRLIATFSRVCILEISQILKMVFFAMVLFLCTKNRAKVICYIMCQLFLCIIFLSVAYADETCFLF